MKRILASLPLMLLMGLPLTSFAQEQTFTQDGLRTTIKLIPDELVAGQKIALAVTLDQNGKQLTDRTVSLEVYEKDASEPVLKRQVDLLDDAYIDSWNFSGPGEYRVVLSITDPQEPLRALHYEVRASVRETRGNNHEDHGFFAHHFGGGKWGWWGTGLMVVMMVPMFILVL